MKNGNSTAICIASGPSLTQDDVNYCRGKGIFYAVKESAYLAPWADVLYAADTDWWDMKDRWEWFQGEKMTLSSEASIKYGLSYIDYDPKFIWSENPAIIASGGNSGFQALNIAYLRGATKIILLGYDMGHTGQKHWWDKEHKRDSRNSDYHKWIEHFKKAAPMIKANVINCTRETALDCFPRMSLEDAFNCPICPRPVDIT